MDPNRSESSDLLAFDRRKMVELMLAGVAAYAVAGQAVAQTHAHALATTGGPAPGEPSVLGYVFFTKPEQIGFLEAAVARIIPSDELGPGALETGSVVYIDRYLAGPFGINAGTYRQGPFAPSTPLHGYQSSLSNADIFKIGISAVDAYCNEKYGKPLAELPPEHQDSILKGMDAAASERDSEQVPIRRFLEMLISLTKQGFFADPMYGGNRDKASWRMIGYPGGMGMYQNTITKHNVPYEIPPEPKGVVDLQKSVGMIK